MPLCLELIYLSSLARVTSLKSQLNPKSLGQVQDVIVHVGNDFTLVWQFLGGGAHFSRGRAETGRGSGGLVRALAGDCAGEAGSGRRRTGLGGRLLHTGGSGAAGVCRRPRPHQPPLLPPGHNITDYHIPIEEKTKQSKKVGMFI